MHEYYVLLFILAVLDFLHYCLTVKIIPLGSNVVVRMTEGLIQEKHKRQSDSSSVCLIGVFGKLLSLPFLLALQAGGLAFRY